MFKKFNVASEYWSARELAVALDYVQWRNFEKVIKRAMIAYENSGHNVLDDFAEVSKIVEAVATHNVQRFTYGKIICLCNKFLIFIIFQCLVEKFFRLTFVFGSDRL